MPAKILSPFKGIGQKSHPPATVQLLQTDRSTEDFHKGLHPLTVWHFSSDGQRLWLQHPPHSEPPSLSPTTRSPPGRVSNNVVLGITGSSWK